jgi:hypothetical protein
MVTIVDRIENCVCRLCFVYSNCCDVPSLVGLFLFIVVAIVIDISWLIVYDACGESETNGDARVRGENDVVNVVVDARGLFFIAPLHLDPPSPPSLVLDQRIPPPPHPPIPSQPHNDSHTQGNLAPLSNFVRRTRIEVTTALLTYMIKI